MMKHAFVSLVCATAVCAAFEITAIPAVAQTATNLKCKGCVGTKDLGKNSVALKNIRKNAVDSTKIKDGSVAAADLAADATPSGASFASSSTTWGLNSSEFTVLSVSTEVPGPGILLVTATGSLDLTGGSRLQCAISEDGAIGSNPAIWAETYTGVPAKVPFAGIRAFEVVKGGKQVNLVCRALVGSGSALPTVMTTQFVPNHY